MNKKVESWREEKLHMEETWQTYQKLVLSEIERLNQNIENLIDKTHKNEIEISTLKVQTSILAIIAGTIASVGTTLLSLVGKN